MRITSAEPSAADADIYLGVLLLTYCGSNHVLAHQHRILDVLRAGIKNSCGLGSGSIHLQKNKVEKFQASNLVIKEGKSSRVPTGTPIESSSPPLFFRRNHF